MFENRALRRTFGSRSDELTGEWMKLHNEELNELYCSPSIVRVIKLRGMSWAAYISHMGNRRSADKILVGKPEGETTWTS